MHLQLFLNSEAGYVLLGRNKKMIWLKICKDACGIPMHDKAKTISYGLVDAGVAEAQLHTCPLGSWTGLKVSSHL